MTEYIGKAIAFFRESRKMTQTDLAGVTGIRQPNISAYEGGRRSPSDENLHAIAKALDVSINQIKERAESYRTSETPEYKQMPLFPEYDTELYKSRVASIYRFNDIVIELTNDILLGINIRIHDIPFEITEKMSKSRYGIKPSHQRTPSMVDAAIDKVIRDMLRDHKHEIVDRLKNELHRANYTIEEVIDKMHQDSDDFY
jgi:transcriptional regulator with XRE-family HTH domain